VDAVRKKRLALQLFSCKRKTNQEQYSKQEKIRVTVLYRGDATQGEASDQEALGGKDGCREKEERGERREER
jgi:hypothetical protein